MTVTAITKGSTAERTKSNFLWLDLTRMCQLKCLHCYNASGPGGTHGTMTREDWIGVLDQAVTCGVRHVQFIGGEPTMHPGAAELVSYALTIGLGVEVFSNLVHVTPEWWELLQRDGATLATSYYSNRAEEHNAITGRRSHGRTRANIEEAVRLGIPLRVGIIADGEAQHVGETRQELETLGVTKIGVDHVRAFGRGARDQAPDPANLCGQCGTGQAAISPTGAVSPCVFSAWMRVGNVKDVPLAAILSSDAMTQANTSIRSAISTGSAETPACNPSCAPIRHKCPPHCEPNVPPCRPRCEPNWECSPGYPSNECDPKK